MWSVMTWNSNTINGFLPMMTNSGAAVVAAIETHATQREGDWYKDHLARKGWGSTWSHAQVTRHGRSSGGVAILNAGGQVEQIAPSRTLEQYVQSGRLAMGLVHSHRLGSEVRVYALYGDPYSEENAEQMLRDVVGFASEWNHRPQILLGDFNLSRDSVVMEEVIQRGGWNDAVPQVGTFIEPSCYPNGVPSRIDHVLVNGVMAKSCASGGVIRDSGTQPHCAVWAGFKNHGEGGCCVGLPRKCQLSHMNREGLLRWQLHHEAQWRTAMNWAYEVRNPEHIYRTLSKKWEAYLRLVYDKKLQGGRGQEAAQENHRGPKKERSSYVEERVRRAYGQALALRRFSELRQEAEIIDMKDRLRRTIRRLPAEIAKDAQLLIGEEEELVQYLKEKWEGLRMLASRSRKKAWKEKMEAKDMRAVAEALREPRQLPVAMLRQGTEWTADPQQLLEEIRAAWHSTMEADRDPCEGIEEFLFEVPFSPYQYHALTVEDVKEALKKLKVRTAPGPDGWRASEVAKLPVQALAEDLCRFYSFCEELGQWPHVWKEAWMAALPKPGKPRSAENVRPISLYCIFYRIWSAARSVHQRQWLDTVIHERQSAFRSSRSAEAEAFRLSALLEGKRDCCLAGISFDMTKAYDNVSHAVLEKIARRMGMTDEMWNALRQATLCQSRRWKLQSGWLGNRFYPIRGIGQGCALSVATFNLYVAPLVHSIKRLWPHAVVLSYADDLSVIMEEGEGLQDVVAYIERYAVATGLSLNPGKCVYFASGVWERAPASVHVGRKELLPQDQVDLLGVRFKMPFGLEHSEVRGDKRKKEVRRRLAVLANMKIATEQKQKAVTGIVMPVHVYGSWSEEMTGAEERGLRHQTIKSIHGRVAHGPRCAEVLMGAFGSFTQIDPGWTRKWRTLQLFRSQLAAEPATWDTWLKNEEEGCFKKGPIGQVQAMVRELGGYREGKIVHIGPHEAKLEVGEEEEKAKHVWREAIRQLEWRRASRRRHDMEGLEGVHRKSLWMQQKSHNEEEKALLRVIQSGGLCTQDRLYRHSKIGQNATCPCGRGPANAEHMLWSCESTQRYWEEWGDQAPVRRCERYCALPMEDRSNEYHKKLAQHALWCVRQWRSVFGDVHAMVEEEATG